MIENQILTNIKTRRSIRAFRQERIPEDIIDAIIEAGRFAPSALNRQGWKFVAVSDRRLIRAFSEAARTQLTNLYKLSPLLKLFSKELRDERTAAAIKKTATSGDDTVFYNAPLIIFIANDSRIRSTGKDCYLAAQNMMLAAHSLGVGSCCIGRARAIPGRLLREKLQVEPFYSFNLCAAFGFPVETRRTPPPRREGTVKKI